MYADFGDNIGRMLETELDQLIQVDDYKRARKVLAARRDLISDELHENLAFHINNMAYAIEVCSVID